MMQLPELTSAKRLRLAFGQAMQRRRLPNAVRFSPASESGALGQEKSGIMSFQPNARAVHELAGVCTCDSAGGRIKL